MLSTTTNAAVVRDVLATPASVGMVRDLVVHTLDKWGLAYLCEDAALVMSELLTNAGTATGWCSTVRFCINRRESGVIVAVQDDVADLPQERRAIASLSELDALVDDEDGRTRQLRGRGLLIATALASDLWVEPAPQGGKWVCALFPYKGDK